MDWLEGAACRGVTGVEFAPLTLKECDERAFALCAVCPVKQECSRRGRAEGWAWWTIHGGLPPLRLTEVLREVECPGCGFSVAQTRRNPRRVWCSARCRMTHANPTKGFAHHAN